ncbi:MAG: GntR family transcriptional regulator [Chitinivibrionales bacterium]|nr:GntR family transcriptional regulator [Chitinivibrionales bacterium]
MPVLRNRVTMGRNSHAVTTVMQYLAVLVKRERLRAGDMFPPLRAIAQGAGVSYAAVARTIGLLADAGYVRTRQGSGVHLVRADLPEHVPKVCSHRPPSFSPRWVETSRAIERDIVAGAFAWDDPLPARKELARRYGVCAQTLAQALRDLVSRNVLEYDRGQLRALRSSSSRAHGTVVVIARGQPGQDLFTRVSDDYLRLLEDVCTKAGLRVAPVLLGYRQPRLQILDERGEELLVGRGRRPVVGYVVLLRGFPPNDIDPFIGRVLSRNTPVAVIDHDRVGQGLHSLIGARNAVLLHPTPGRTAGAELGRHLLRDGHRRIAFVSCYHGERWSRERLDGLRDAYAAVDDAVMEATRSAPDAPWRPPSVRTRLGTALGELARKHMPHRHALNTRLRRALPTIEDDIRRALMRQNMVESLRPVLEDCTTLSACSALVAVNDETALACATLLSERAGAGHRRPALAAFDNSRDAFIGGLTSYDFNEPAIAQAALEAVLGPPSARRAAGTRLNSVVVPGHVVMRG